MANNSILSEVYNYYQVNYAPKSTSRFDSHKKSELKSIYNSIINQSKEEPVFLLRHSRDIEKYTIDMKESAMRFSRDIAQYGGPDSTTLFEKKAAISSNTALATVDFIHDEDMGIFNDENMESSVENNTAEIYISEIAKPQINKGIYLEPDILSLEAGTYSFDVTTHNSTYELQLSVSQNDTNKTIQSRLARLINTSGIGLSASLSSNSYQQCALSISSTSTGNEDGSIQPFEITDDSTSQKKGIVDYLGIRYSSQDASWAKYKVNDTDYVSPDNRILVNGKYQITLHGKSKDINDVVTIGTKPDYDSLKDSISGVISSYNTFMDTVSKYINKQPRTSLLIDAMKKMSSHYFSSIEDLNYNIDDNGTIKIDENDLAAALSGENAEQTVATLKDFTKSAVRKINQIQINPMDYVDKRIVAYKDPSKQHFANPYVTSAYSGMLFNSYM